MNPAQCRLYHTRLWPAACRAQGWDPKDADRRRAVTLEITGQGSTTALDQDSISRLFEGLRHLAAPDDYEAAVPAANPEWAAEQDRRRRLLWVIDHELLPARDYLAPCREFRDVRAARPAFADAYVQRCAAGLVKRAVVAHWRDLPAAGLGKLLYTLNQRRQQQEKDAADYPTYEPRKEAYHRREPVRAKRAAAREPQVFPRPEVAAAMQETGVFPF